MSNNLLKRWLSYPSVQIALSVALFVALGYKFGPFGMLFASPLLGVAICRPVMNLVANIRHSARENVWLGTHGQHYVFKGVTVHVMEDEDHFRWVSLADVRKVVGTTAADRALAATFARRFQAMGKPPQPHLRDDALIEHLAKESNPVALRFRTWVDRTIANPARRLRKDAGVTHDPAMDEDEK